MPLTMEEKAKALQLLAYINNDKPHGLSADEFGKEHPDPYVSLFEKVSLSGQPKGVPMVASGSMHTTGGADYKKEYGLHPQFSSGPQYGEQPALGSDPGTVLPYTANQLPNTGANIMNQDPDVVMSMYGMLDKSSKKKIDKIIEKRGPKGYLNSQMAMRPEVGYQKSQQYINASLPDSQINRDWDPNTLRLDDVKPVEMPKNSDIIPDPRGSGKEMVVETSSEKNMPKKPNKKKSYTKSGKIDNRGKKGSDNINLYHNFVQKFKKEKFYDNIENGSKRHATSLVYELLKELDDIGNKDPDMYDKMNVVKKKVIDFLNKNSTTMCAGTRNGKPRLMNKDEVVKAIYEIRKDMNKKNPKVKVVSKKLDNYRKLQEKNLGLKNPTLR